MRNEDCSLRLVSNGEIYNHAERRHELVDDRREREVSCLLNFALWKKEHIG